MTVTLDQIKSLRAKTGVSTMACKKALEEAGGDEEKAIELLRKKGEAKAAERADRSTSNGVVAIASEGGKTAMLALACETDFVAKNEDFVKAANDLAKKLLTEGAEADLEGVVSDLTVSLGEKIAINEKVLVEGDQIGSYIHLNNKIGVLIKLNGSGDSEAGNGVAMHIAAMNPANISPEDVSDALVEKEKGIWTEQLKQEGKPEEIIGKIMMGKEKKFREESALLTQPFVKNPEMLIKDVLAGFTVENFWRFEI
jgi:elongation factor Ts